MFDASFARVFHISFTENKQKISWYGKIKSANKCCLPSLTVSYHHCVVTKNSVSYHIMGKAYRSTPRHHNIDGPQCKSVCVWRDGAPGWCGAPRQVGGLAHRKKPLWSAIQHALICHYLLLFVLPEICRVMSWIRGKSRLGGGHVVPPGY